MSVPDYRATTFLHRLRHNRAARLVIGALVTVLGIGTVSTPAAAAASLSLKAYTSAWQKVGPSRTTSIAEITVKVPANPVEFGLQFRAAKKSSGYRTKVGVDRQGKVSASFSRVTSYKQSGLTGSRPLGFTVRPGDTLHLEATVAATSPVRLYLRAWKDGTTKPTSWLASSSDASTKRIKTAGATYLWARTPSGSPRVTLPFAVKSVAAYTAAKAAAVGQPTSPPAASSPGDTFSIAVIGDTQDETNFADDTRFRDRTSWLAANKDTLDLRYVLHTGDMVNWGWLDPPQYTHARNAMAILTAAGLPWSVTVGNHDTRAVGWNNIEGSTGYGGSAYERNPECVIKLSPQECKTTLLVRQTAEFNDSFPVGSLAGLGGTFEPGKIDNAWTSFTANDTKWLVLNLEFAPRRSAVAWARAVVASHPDHNVIIDTHYYLSGSGAISTSNAGYGETSGKYLYDEIVSKYANVKIVVSGHVGRFASRTDSNGGNTTVSYLGDKLDGGDNPVRVLTIDTASGQVTNTVYRRVKPGSEDRYSTGTAKISIIR